MKKRILGLDLGPNSIGWALIEEDQNEALSGALIDMGVRVFPEGVDKFDTGNDVSRNAARRIARSMRRQTQRRVRRRRQLKAALRESGLWPQDENEETELYKLDPYELRAKALHEKLTPHEIGRVLLHLNQRRGFLSNRKKDRGNDETSAMLREINHNEKERVDSGYETIGELLAHKASAFDHRNRSDNDHVRNRHLARRQFDQEFDAIWEAQRKHHPSLLTESLQYGRTGKTPESIKPRQPKRVPSDSSLLKEFGIHGLIFFQRPMYWPKSVIGRCELEREQPRCPLSDRRYQRFRLLQEVNNLRYVDPDTNEPTTLSSGQRQLVIEKLSVNKERSFNQIRKALGFLESCRFTFERGERSKLKGVPIDAMFAEKNVLGKKWYQRPNEERDAIVAELLDNEDEGGRFIKRAVSEWGMSAEEADRALSVDLPAGYGRLSLKAIQKLLPFLEKGMIYMANDESDSAMHAAGYGRSDEMPRKIFDWLPSIDIFRSRSKTLPSSQLRLGDIANPVVLRTLTEVRKVVNAILREYGKPDAVHIEMARQVRQGKDARDEYSKRIREREKKREFAAGKLRENSIRVNRDNILRYLLWEEQRHECIYSGKPINFAKLFQEGGGVEVDHILPYSRTLDDSQLNKVVCLREANQTKGNKTPHEWLASSQPDQFAEVCQRANKLLQSALMPYAKYRRFLQKELELDDFINRQLSDTSYITKATLEYIRCLFDKDHQVLGLKGQLTAELRYQWGLNTVLSEIPDSPGWQDAKAENLTAGEKNRADHRHHAIDALIIAATNRVRLRQLSKLVKTGGAKAHGEILEDPWPDFRHSVFEAAKRINVSHRVDARVRGQLHDQNPLGEGSDAETWVMRKALVDLSANEIEKIRDGAIQRLVIARLKEHGIEFGRDKKPNAKQMKEALSDLRMPSRVPIKKVRIEKKDRFVVPIRKHNDGQSYVKPGSTHHVEIFKIDLHEKTTYRAVYVTQLEAHHRKRDEQKSIIKRCLDDEPNAQFIFSLSPGEMILADTHGSQRLLVLTTATQGGSFRFVEHSDARRRKDSRLFYLSLKAVSLANKVTVDLLGSIRNVNTPLDLGMDLGSIDERVLQIAKNSLQAGLSNTTARKQLAQQKLGSYGADLSVALKYLRENR